MKDYYRILQITPDASLEEVKKAYRRLAKVHHPDVADSGREQAEIFIQDLNEAYRTLSSPDKRSYYDWQRTNLLPIAAEESPRLNTRHYESVDCEKISLKERLVLPYMKWVYNLNKIALIFCLLLAIDFFLPLKQRADKVIYFIEVYATGSNTHNHTNIQTWSGRKLTVSPKVGKYLAQNPNMLLYSTKVFGKPRYVAAAAKAKVRHLIDRSLYGNFIFLPLLLLLTSFLGSIKRFSAITDFSLGLATALLLLICVGFLVVH